MSRETLPNRRVSDTFEFQAGVPGHPLQRYIATIGYYPDGRIGEIFCHPTKTGSDRDISVQEACIAVSFALQHGCTVEAVRSGMPRTMDGEPEGVVGKILDLLAEERKDCAA